MASRHLRADEWVSRDLAEMRVTVSIPSTVLTGHVGAVISGGKGDAKSKQAALIGMQLVS